MAFHLIALTARSSTGPLPRKTVCRSARFVCQLGGTTHSGLGPTLGVSRVYDSMSDTGDRDARGRLEEFLAGATVEDLRNLLRHLGDSGGDDERVLHVVMQLLGSHPIRLASASVKRC